MLFIAIQDPEETIFKEEGNGIENTD